MQPPEHDTEFTLKPDAFWGMTGPQYTITVAPAVLFRRFGYPLLNDRDSESLGTYVFVSPSGAVTTIYFRANDVWSLLLKLIKKSFWRSSKPTDLTVGAENLQAATEFCQWLASLFEFQVRRWP